MRRRRFINTGLIPLFLLALVFSGCKEKPSASLLLITGENNHDWKATTPVLRTILEDAGFGVRVTENPADLESPGMKDYAGVVLNYNRDKRWPETTEKALLDFVSGGKALIIVHASNNAFPGWEEFEEMAGLTWRQGATHDSYGEFTVNIMAKDHPIMKGLEDFTTTDELYNQLTPKGEYEVLATVVSNKDRQAHPMIIVRGWGRGRVFHTLLGHDVPSMQVEGFTQTLQRGTLWAAGILDGEVTQSR